MLMNGKIMFDRYYCINSTKHCENEENIGTLYFITSSNFPKRVPGRVGRQESVGPAPPFFASDGPQTGIWSAKIEVKEDTDEMKIVFEPSKR